MLAVADVVDDAPFVVQFSLLVHDLFPDGESDGSLVKAA
jgi:hypothetical protein